MVSFSWKIKGCKHGKRKGFRKPKENRSNDWEEIEANTS
jgi:hypothetical protein